jgi:transcriptional regulator with PAS, ATPase and Fis domain
LKKPYKRAVSEWICFYRVNMFVIEVPPLRDRLSDIPELAQHFLLAIRSGTHQVESISQAALSALCQHNWPGNVREAPKCNRTGSDRLQ